MSGFKLIQAGKRGARTAMKETRESHFTALRYNDAVQGLPFQGITLHSCLSIINIVNDKRYNVRLFSFNHQTFFGYDLQIMR